MPKIYNINQVDTILDKKMEQLIDYVTNKAYYKLRENIVNQAYNEEDNTDYFNNNGRTGQFLESFEKDKIRTEMRTVIGRVFQNINVMQLMNAQSGNIWNAHKSMLGEDVRSELGWFLNSTNTGMWQGSRKGGFWDDTLNWIEQHLDDIVLEGAREVGIPIKRK